MSKITLWIPAAESPRWPCVESWLMMEYPDGDVLNFVRSKANNVKFSWNEIVRNFLRSDADWLFSCHNDVVFHPQTLPRLMSWGKTLVSALIFMRQSPVLPHIWRSYQENGHYAMRVRDTRDWFLSYRRAITPGPFVIDPRPDDALVDVSFTSTSCTLIHRSVLEDIKVLVDAGEDEELKKYPWFLMDDDLAGGGEDRRFYENARKAGHIPYVDRSCIAGHLVGDVPTGALDFLAWESVSDFMGTGEPEGILKKEGDLEG